jgi:hypothetical protein
MAAQSKKGKEITMDYEKTESRNEMRIAREQDWLRERESFWSSPESTPEIDEWQSEMHEFTGTYYSKTEIYEMLDSLTATIVGVFLNLDGLTPNNLLDTEYILNQTLDGPVACPFYEEVIEMANAKILIATGGEFGCAAEKILGVIGSVGLVFDKKPTGRVMRALQNAVRARVLGQDAACIDLCRTVLELALKEKVSYKMLVKHLVGKKPPYGLLDRITVAVKEGLLTETIRKLANNVRERANKICHEDTSLTQNVGQIFYETCRVVCILYTGKDPMRSSFSDAKLKV